MKISDVGLKLAARWPKIAPRGLNIDLRGFKFEPRRPQDWFRQTEEVPIVT